MKNFRGKKVAQCQKSKKRTSARFHEGDEKVMKKQNSNEGLLSFCFIRLLSFLGYVCLEGKRL